MPRPGRFFHIHSAELVQAFVSALIFDASDTHVSLPLGARGVCVGSGRVISAPKTCYNVPFCIHIWVWEAKAELIDVRKGQRPRSYTSITFMAIRPDSSVGCPCGVTAPTWLIVIYHC